MILAVDSSALAMLINPDSDPPNDPVTGLPVERARERVEHFIAGLSAADTMVLPTPALAEALVRAGEAGPSILLSISTTARIKVRAYGERAAVETAQMTREAIELGDKRSGSIEPWQKVKVDRQIIATARVENATQIYADDKGLVNFAKLLGMDVFSTWDLPLPPAPPRDLLSDL